MPATVLKEFYASDLGRLGLPVELGGSLTDLKTQVYIIEELHRAAGALLPVLSHYLSMHVIRVLGGERQLELVEEMITTTGAAGFSEAMTEPFSGSDLFAVQTTAATVGDKILLNGTKTYVSNGLFAPYILVLARDVDESLPGSSLTFWLIPRNIKGVNVFPIESAGQKLVPQAIIHFDDVELEPSHILKHRGSANKAIMPSLDIGRTLLCASSLGLAEAAMDDAVRYASKRESGGKLLIDLAQIQEKLTDMEVGIRAMRSAVYEAADKYEACVGFADHEANMAFKLSAALAKRMVPKMATKIASESMQIQGGLGYTQLSRAGRILNDCRGNQIAQGTDEVMVKICAKRIASNYREGKL